MIKIKTVKGNIEVEPEGLEPSRYCYFASVSKTEMSTNSNTIPRLIFILCIFFLFAIDSRALLIKITKSIGKRMTIRAQQLKVFLFVIKAVTIYMVNL